MNQIWKTQLEPGRDGFVQIPANSRPISVHEQNGLVCIWWEVINTKQPLVSRRYWIVRTGKEEYPLPHEAVFLGTIVFQNMQNYVVHVYVGREE